MTKALAISQSSVKRVTQKEIQALKAFQISWMKPQMLHTLNRQIKEHFLQLCNVYTSGGALEKVVIALLEENDLKMENTWGKGYDGTANTSRVFNQES